MAPSLRLQGVISYLVLCVCLSCLSFYAMYSSVSCSVTGGGTASSNGFYKGVAGVFLQAGEQRSYFPDLYQLIKDRNTYSGMGIIHYDRSSYSRWEVINFSSGTLYYFTDKESGSDSSHPADGTAWLMSNSTEVLSPSISSYCNGDVRKTVKKKSNGSSSNSNLQQMLSQPVTMVIILLICYAAYCINIYRVDVTEVSFSYDTIWVREEYYRCITAAFAHFDLMHLGFNTMSLYQLGGLEALFGSFGVAYLSLDLVFITSFIMITMYHIAIMRYGRIDYTHQQGVGYSCVLFAWVVVAAVKLAKYCPLFLIPDICFTTYTLPLQDLGLGLEPLPFNIGPIVLLVATKVFIPQSSFSGHLAGIIIGFPLAWNMLNWMTMQQLAAILCFSYIARNSDRLLLWKIPGFDLRGSGYFGETASLEEFESAEKINRFKILQRLSYAVYASDACVLVFGGYRSGLAQAFPRGVAAFAVFSAVHARRLLWLTDARSTQETCQRLMLLALVLCAVHPLHDLPLAAGAAAAMQMVTANGCSTLLTAASIVALLGASIAHTLFALALLLSLHELRSTAVEGVLRWMLCDRDSTQSDLRMLRHFLSCGGMCAARSPFGTAVQATASPFGTAAQATASPLHTAPTEDGLEMGAAARGGYTSVSTSDSDAVSSAGSKGREEFSTVHL